MTVITHQFGDATIHEGDVREGLKQIEPGTINVCVTSPPYWRLRSYLEDDDPRKPLEFGSEETPGEFVSNLVGVFEQLRPAMASHGVIFVNLADTYCNDKAVSGLKPRDRAGIPERFALAMLEAGFWWRDTIIWHKTSPMPMSFNGWRWERCRVKTVAGRTGSSGVGTIGAIGKRREGTSHLDPANNAQWSNCPGCKKCEPNDGYVLRKGSFRTTANYEPILMFTVSDSYYCDREAVAGPASAGTIERNRYSRITGTTDREQYAVQHDHEFNGETRNPRSIWAAHQDVAEQLDLFFGEQAPAVTTIGPDSYRGEHYAAFPRELPERCLRMGMSGHGYCETCGMPWARVVEVSYENPGARSTNGPQSIERKHINGGSPGFECRLERRAETSGWRPTCQCGTNLPQPGLVCDPFAGTGTTAEVALKLGHRFVGCELNSKYIDQIKERLVGKMPLFCK